MSQNGENNYIKPDWKVLKEDSYWQWTDMLDDKGHKLFNELYKQLNDKCTRGQWKVGGQLVREPKRSIIVKDLINIDDQETVGFRESEISRETQGTSSINKNRDINVTPHDTYDWSDFPIIRDIGLQIFKELKIDDKDTLFHYCLVNIYDNGKDGIGWHSDREAGKTNIVSVSLGETRDFAIRSIDQTTNGGKLEKKEIKINSNSLGNQRFLDNFFSSKTPSNLKTIIKRPYYESPNTIKIPLWSGDVFHMKDGCQERYKHELCRTDKKVGPRINLTFRRFPDHIGAN